jgi:hypothetical protein
MKRSKRSGDTARAASTLATAQLGRIRGGAGMTEYIILAQTPREAPIVPDCWSSFD